MDDFLISGAKIHAHLTGLVNKEIILPLPEIHLTGLGQGNDGITAAELTRKVLGAITTGTLKALAGSVTDLGKNLTGAATDAAQNAGKAAGEGVNQVKKGLGGLFGK